MYNGFDLLFFLLGGGLSNLGSISSFNKGFLQPSKPGKRPVEKLQSLVMIKKNPIFYCQNYYGI